MGPLEDVQRLEWKHYSVATLSALAIVGPGYLCVMLFRPNLMTQLDVVKLLILAASLTLPLAGANSFLYAYAASPDPERDVAPHDTWIIGAVTTTVVMYVALYGAYLTHLPFRPFTFVVAGFEALYVLSCYLMRRSLIRATSA